MKNTRVLLCLLAAVLSTPTRAQEDRDAAQLAVASDQLIEAFEMLIAGPFVNCGTNPVLCNDVKRRLSEAHDRIGRYFSANVRRDARGVCLDGDPFEAYALASYLRLIGRTMWQRGSGNSYSGMAEQIKVHLDSTPLCKGPTVASSPGGLSISPGDGNLPPLPAGTSIKEGPFRESNCADRSPRRTDPTYILVTYRNNCPAPYITRGKKKVEGTTYRWCAYCGPGFTTRLDRTGCCVPKR